MKIMVEAYWNRDKIGVLEYMRVVCREDKRVNMVHRWCIIL